MIRDAISSHPAFSGVGISVYAKGSYANNTNVRLDSDVDVVVQCESCLCYDYAHGVSPPVQKLPSYEGIWTPEKWRQEVTNAVVNFFGASEVDTSGNIALTVAEKAGSRPSADVVPSFDYALYWSTDGSRQSKGSTVYPKNGGARIVNWPQQQLDNGRSKNVATARRYKSFVRALKNAENYLAGEGRFTEKPSYLMECIVYNASNAVLNTGSLDDDFAATLVELWEGLTSKAHEEWVEPNAIKYLFHSDQKWTMNDASQVVAETWRMFYAK